MIGHLRGELFERGLGQVIVDCGGVGYEVQLSSHSLATLGEEGSTVSLRIYTQALEHKITLYGFASRAERELFDLLITVKNVGPASALKILSAGEGPINIARMIAAKEPKALKGIKGIGKKTSEMLIVELHEKCEALLMTWAASGMVEAAAVSGKAAPPPPERTTVHEDVIAALVQMGFKQIEAEKAVDAVPVEPAATLESVMRQALQAMPR